MEIIAWLDGPRSEILQDLGVENWTNRRTSEGSGKAHLPSTVYIYIYMAPSLESTLPSFALR